jgi:hypothetical protein
MSTSLPPTFDDLKREQGRQLEHWRLAAGRLADFDSVAPTSAWQALEYYIGVSLRQTLADTTSRLQRWGDELAARLAAAKTPAELRPLRGQILEFRRRYLKAETTIDFYGDALATRASPRLGALLRACDHIATRSMAEALSPMGRQVPAALSYLDSGIGASILKAGLRLWDGTAESPVASIKVVRHNLLRPTSIIHEAGHQVAFMLGWVDQLAARLREGLSTGGLGRVADTWAGWASEIAADAFAFVHTGYAAVAALHDVVDGGRHKVFDYLPYDPHPTSYLRVLLGVEMCRSSYGPGPWDALAAAWTAQYPIEQAPADSRGLLEGGVALLPQATQIVLRTPYPAFDGRPLIALVNPERVSPASLADLERAIGPIAVRSTYLIWNESIRLLALTGYRATESAQALRVASAHQEQWMVKLGGLRRAA